MKQRIRVSQLQQKLKTSNNNAKIESHIKSLQYNSDKAEFEEMKRKYDALGDNEANQEKIKKKNKKFLINLMKKVKIKIKIL